MNIQHRCGELKDRVAAELHEVRDPEVCSEELIGALYEMSRSILPELGQPGSSENNPEGQRAVLELISFLAISLIRNCNKDGRGVAVLIEIGEGCRDPLVKKQLRVYAQELLDKSRRGTPKEQPAWKRGTLWTLGVGGAAVLALHLALPVPQQKVTQGKEAPKAIAISTGSPETYQAATPKAASQGPDDLLDDGRARAKLRADLGAQAPPEGKGAESAELSTKVRIANNQVLVPVTLKNGGESVRAELVLDTGSTRTLIHEGLASRLHLDLRLAKFSQSELADGRLIRSRSTTIDSLNVGPFAMSLIEVDLLPYKGSEGLHDGLLGMDFLSKHRYLIDMEHEVIRWF